MNKIIVFLLQVLLITVVGGCKGDSSPCPTPHLQMTYYLYNPDTIKVSYKSGFETIIFSDSSRGDSLHFQGKGMQHYFIPADAGGTSPDCQSNWNLYQARDIQFT